MNSDLENHFLSIDPSSVKTPVTKLKQGGLQFQDREFSCHV